MKDDYKFSVTNLLLHPIKMSKLRVRFISAYVLLFAMSGTIAADEISFNRDVRPILSDRCYQCHGPDAENQESAFRLDSREHALTDLGGYAGVVPGDLKKSELHARIHADDDGQMPPTDSNRVLSDREKEILDAWIVQGAPFEEHWGFRRIPDEVPIPIINSASNTNDAKPKWVRNDIDSFILSGINHAGLSPNGELSRDKWLRRITFDLTGLPPTLEEIDAFVNDTSSDAYERVVDRLLLTDACAERLTSEWLDVARYSDSFGYQRDDERYVWPWRDWVVRAFRNNMPYDQFITEQLAGDLLPNPTTDQILATTFNRLHSHNKEGGVAVEEFRVEYVSDRVHTFAGAFMGLTMECARCHDHKFDPIKTKEYYQLSAFFANIAENGLISYFTDVAPTPAMALPTVAQQAELDAASTEIAAAQRKLEMVITQGEPAFEQWLSQHESTSEISDLVTRLAFDELGEAAIEECIDEEGKKVAPEKMRSVANLVDGAKRAITPKKNLLVPGKTGNAIKFTGDDAVVIPEVAHYRRHDPFSFSLWINTPEITERAVIFRRSRGWDDCGSIGYELTKEGDKLIAKLSHFWPGDAIGVETNQPLESNRWYHVAVTYDGSSKAAGLKIFIDGTLAETTIVQDHLTRDITTWRGGYNDLAIGSRYRDRGFKDGQVDEFSVFNRTLSALEVAQLYDTKSLVESLSLPAAQLNHEQRSALREYYFSAIHVPAREARDDLRTKRARWTDAMDATAEIMVMREEPMPRPTYVLKRGVYDSHGEEVSAGTPAFLPEFPADQPRNRLGLARWLTSTDHPLTARVTVNRYWQLMFGKGLVRTPEDFGNQAQPPSHPELLDWLARDFIDHGWDVNRLLRMIALSATYRQDSVVSTKNRNKDPENIWLARGPDQRLSAEMVRDNALAVSGLLVNTVGGPPVKPYDVALAYTPLPVDKGDGLYRRSLYTFWRRTSPAPVMITMDANKREVCRLRREVTASPLQAMVLLNAPQFIEASRVLASKLLQKQTEIDPLAEEAFRLLTSRRPSDRELEILRRLYEEQLEHFTANPDLATELLKTGDAPSPGDSDPSQVAAITVLVNSIMNLDESVRNR
jgi:hypothetical protein